MKRSQENTTELISETEQEVPPTTDEITSNPQAQETTIVAPVISTTIVTQNNEPSSEIATTPMPTTPMPTTMYSESSENNPRLIRIEGKMYEGFKFSSKNRTDIDKNIELEISIDAVKYYFENIDFLNSSCQFNFDIDISFTSPCSLYYTYDIYNSNNICVKTDSIEFVAEPLDYNNTTVHRNICVSLPIDDYTIKFYDAMLKLPS